MHTTTLDKRRSRERSIEETQKARILKQIGGLVKQYDAIEANGLVREEEDANRRKRRFARNDRREAKAEVRYALTRERRAKVARSRPVYRLWNYIYERWQKKGSNPEGVEVAMHEMKAHLSKHCEKTTRGDIRGFSERQVGRLVAEMVQCKAIEVHKHGRLARTYLPKLEGCVTWVPDRTCK